MSTLPRGSTIRRDAGLYGYERALRRAGLAPVAGVDEAGRGACAGPLVAAAAILPEGKAGLVPELADSKLLTAKARERCYAQVLARALAWSVVVVDSEECDRLGMHVANVEALRRSLARLELRPSYVLTDGTQTIEAYATQGDMHTDELLVFYLPKPKILVEADSYSPGPPNTPPPSPVPPNAVTLYNNIQRLKLNVATIAPIHGRGPVPMSEFMKFIAKRS